MLRGQDEVRRNLERWYQGRQRRLAEAMNEITALLENTAKTDHGDTPREAGTVYPGGGVKRWREAGAGWGDVTAATNTGIRGFVAEATPLLITVVLSSRTDYSVYLERAMEGKWSWLWPAVEKSLPEIRRILHDAVRMG